MKDDDLGLKIGLPVVLIILTVLFIVLILRTRRKEEERSKPTQGDLGSRNNPAYDPYTKKHYFWQLYNINMIYEGVLDGFTADGEQS